VLASGANISLAKAAGFTYGRASSVAARGYAPNAAGIDRCTFWMMPGAYAWAFPCPDGFVNVGIHSFTGSKVFSSDVERLSLLRVGAPAERVQTWPLRCEPRRSLVGKRIILVGENAETTYDLTGEGIGPAIESGINAGLVLANVGPSYDKSDLQVYEQLMSADRRIASSLRFLANIMNYGMGERLTFFVAGINSSLTEMVARGERPAKDLFMPWNWSSSGR